MMVKHFSAGSVIRSWIPKADHPGEPGDENNQAILVTTEDALTPQLSTAGEIDLRCLIEGDSTNA